MKRNSLSQLNSRLDWLDSDDVRPYILARNESRVSRPGRRFNLNWFPKEPIFIDPLKMDDIYFSNALLNMESKAFESSDMAMPRWVFFDCAVMPGFISGFARRTSSLPASIRRFLGEENLTGEWTPISLFIIIPTMVKKEWVAHNLSSINSLIPKEDRMYGLGFLSKAFGLAYGNIEICCGMTQWTSPAIRLHSHYGQIEVLTAYTPAHSYARTLTYRLIVDPAEWVRFFTGEKCEDFQKDFEYTGILLDPKSEKSIIDFQRKIEGGKGPFYLDAGEIRSKPLDSQFKVYRPKAK